MTLKLQDALYENIRHIIIKTLPENWSTVKIYGEVDSERCYSFFYVWLPENSTPVFSNTLPEKTGLDAELLADLLDELDDCLISLWEEAQGFNENPWTTLTLTYTADSSETQVQYQTVDLSKSPFEKRQKEWKKKYL